MSKLEPTSFPKQLHWGVHCRLFSLLKVICLVFPFYPIALTVKVCKKSKRKHKDGPKGLVLKTLHPDRIAHRVKLSSKWLKQSGFNGCQWIFMLLLCVWSQLKSSKSRTRVWLSRHSCSGHVCSLECVAFQGNITSNPPLLLLPVNYEKTLISN